MKTQCNFEEESFNISPIRPFDGVENDYQNTAKLDFKVINVSPRDVSEQEIEPKCDEIYFVPVQSENDKSNYPLKEKQLRVTNSRDGKNDLDPINSEALGNQKL